MMLESITLAVQAGMVSLWWLQGFSQKIGEQLGADIWKYQHWIILWDVTPQPSSSSIKSPLSPLLPLPFPVPMVFPGLLSQGVWPDFVPLSALFLPLLVLPAPCYCYTGSYCNRAYAVTAHRTSAQKINAHDTYNAHMHTTAEKQKRRIPITWSSTACLIYRTKVLLNFISHTFQLWTLCANVFLYACMCVVCVVSVWWKCPSLPRWD